MKKKILALLLCLVMVAALVPTHSLASQTVTDTETTEVSEETEEIGSYEEESVSEPTSETEAQETTEEEPFDEEVIEEADSEQITDVDEIASKEEKKDRKETKDPENSETEIKALNNSDTEEIMPLDVDGGDYGDLKWTFDSDTGELTISGEGELEDASFSESVNRQNIPWYGYKDAITSVVIEEGITRIGVYEFYNYRYITSVEIADTVTSIGEYAFYYCTTLETVNLPDNENFSSLEDYLFSHCYCLKSVTVPDSVETIGESVFAYCNALEEVTLSENLKEFTSGYVFNECTSLKEVDIPKNVTAITADMFLSCTSLEKVTAEGEITSIGIAAFRYCSALKEVFDLSQVSSMGTYVFSDCSSLTGTMDLSSLDELPNYTFYNDSYITGVKFSDTLTSIGNYAFYKCNRLDTLNLPDTLTTIGNYAFWNCWLRYNYEDTVVDPGAAVVTRTGEGDTSSTTESVTYSGSTITIPDSVTSIGTRAFEYSYADYFVIGTGMTTLDGAVFASYALKAVIVDNLQYFVAFANQDSLWGHLNSSNADNNVAIIYLDGGIDVEEENAAYVSLDETNPFYNMTLQEAVDAVAAGEMENPITITKDIVLSETLKVPAGNPVEIEAEGDRKFTGKGDVDSLITIEKNGTLLLCDSETDLLDTQDEGSVTMYGNWNSDITSMINVNGSLVINDGAILEKAVISKSKHGAIDVDGPDASFTMKGGIVEDNLIQTVNAATIFISGDAAFRMSGGVIQNNKSTATQITMEDGKEVYGVCVASSGVMLYDSATGEMSDGTFQNNESFNGSAIFLYSNSGAVGSYPVRFTLSGGTITGNTSPHGYDNTSGAIMVQFNASMSMTGGTVSDNYGHSGGGISVADEFISKEEGKYTTEYVMSGGYVIGNSAVLGGGIYSYSNGVHLQAGTIANNSASSDGGGVYGQGFEKTPSTWLHLTNVLIEENEASEQGGGVWLCPSGSAEFYVTNGGVIDNNTAAKVGDDLVFAASRDGEAETSLTLSERILGGGKVDWYQDGRTYSTAIQDRPIVNTAYPRYGAEGYDDFYENNGLEEESSPIFENRSLKAVIEDSAVAFAKTQATLYIIDNDASYGGGVAANGGLEIGENSDTTEISGKKTWDDGDDYNHTRPSAITVTLTAHVGGDSYLLEEKTVTPDENGDWSYIFTNLPIYSGGKEITYTVAEVPVDGYVTRYDGYDITNTALGKLSISKEVSGDSGDASEYEFQISLSKDGEPYTGDINVTYTMETDSAIKDDRTGVVTFENGTGTITIPAGETVTLFLTSGMGWTVTEVTDDADSILIYVDEDVVQRPADTSEAYAAVGTIADSTQVTFVNSYRAYFPIDEEIVTDTDDIFNREAWVKDESVNEYNAIEIEMTTNLPVVTPYDLGNGAFTMNFHEVLDHELILDENAADFAVYIDGNQISAAYYTITFDDDTGDGCNFHVDVDLTKLYADGVISDEDLLGNTEITIFFFADLEGTGLNGSYKSTIWYDIYDGDEWLYTSNVDVVEVYTYEIEIEKYDSTNEDLKLAGATFGIYYDEDCTDPVCRYVGQVFDESEKQQYKAESDEDGMAIFYGLAEGTYYVKELQAPDQYVLSEEILTIELDKTLTESDYAYYITFANTPEEEPGPGDEPGDEPQPGEPTGSDESQPGTPTDSNEGVNPGGSTGGSSSASSTSESSSSAKTADSNSMILYALLLAFCVLAICGVRTGLLRRERIDKRNNHDQ